jgi:hypothetical protein
MFQNTREGSGNLQDVGFEPVRLTIRHVGKFIVNDIVNVISSMSDPTTK